MSFSSQVKEELSSQIGRSRHCQLAELAAIISYEGKIKIKEGKPLLVVTSENTALNTKYQMLLQKIWDIRIQKHALTSEETMRILSAVKVWQEKEYRFMDTAVVNGMLLQQSCCKRAFIRGAFLASGSMSDPNKGYHFEVVCQKENQAEQLKTLMNSFEVDAKVILRKKNYVVYLKEGSHIVDILNVMEAHKSLMDLENVRIVKEMRNSVNRQVNCETANISKTVNAAVRQMEEISYIRAHMGLDQLPDNLKEIALLRMEYPDTPLKELGTYLVPPVGKSGVNHRFRKLSEFAKDLGMHHAEG